MVHSNKKSQCTAVSTKQKCLQQLLKLSKADVPLSKFCWQIILQPQSGYRNVSAIHVCLHLLTEGADIPLNQTSLDQTSREWRCGSGCKANNKMKWEANSKERVTFSKQAIIGSDS